MPADRWVSRLTAGLIAAALAGCAQGQSAGAGHSDVVLLTSAMKATFAMQIADGFRFGVSTVSGVTARVAAPETSDPAQQMSLLRQEVQAGTKSITLSMPLGETNDDPIGKAAQKGARIVAVDSPPAPGSPIKLYVGNDNESLGRLLADTVADRLGAAVTGK